MRMVFGGAVGACAREGSSCQFWWGCLLGNFTGTEVLSQVLSELILSTGSPQGQYMKLCVTKRDWRNALNMRAFGCSQTTEITSFFRALPTLNALPGLRLLRKVKIGASTHVYQQGFTGGGGCVK